MAGRFAIYTDADVRGPLVQAMVRAGWDVVRAIDEDGGALGARAHAFTGLVACPQECYEQMTLGEIVEWFERRAQEEAPLRIRSATSRPRTEGFDASRAAPSSRSVALQEDKSLRVEHNYNPKGKTRQIEPLGREPDLAGVCTSAEGWVR